MIYCPEKIEEHELLRKWLEKRIPYVSMGDDSVCIGVWRNGVLTAVAGFNNYRKVDIELSFAADNPKWATRQTIQGILAFPFIQLETQRCTCMVLKSNRRVRKLLTGIGFKEEGRHGHAGPQLETMLSYGMTRQKYMERYFDGKKEPAVAASGS